MGAHIVAKNLYSKDGILLLAQGQELTEEQVNRLERLGYKDLLNEFISRETDESKATHQNIAERNVLPGLVNTNIVNVQNKNQFEKYKNSIERLQENLNIIDLELFNTASEILENIVFKSMCQPWWIYVNTLSNIDWIYTYSINVALISAMLAALYGLKNINDIALGALLHDIGKLLIPRKILQKPHDLTDEEQIYIQRHCELGKTMLMEANLSTEIYDIIYQHHEKLDGSGYPNALSGSQIPLHSQIVMVADTFDRMTSYWSMKVPENVLSNMENKPEKYPKDIVECMSSLIH